eukprot:SAG31_NODE_761_length_12276_cov_4.530673_15_plen_99_part_00
MVGLIDHNGAGECESCRRTREVRKRLHFLPVFANSIRSVWLFFPAVCNSACEDLFEREREAWQSTSMATKLLSKKVNGTESGNEESTEAGGPQAGSEV